MKTTQKASKRPMKKVSATAKMGKAKSALPKALNKKKATVPAVKGAPKGMAKTSARPVKAAAAKKPVKTRVRSVDTLKRAGLVKSGAKKRTIQSAPETLVSAQLEKLAGKWEALHSKAKSIKTETYNMRKQYERQTGLQHKLLGWGFIIENKNDRLEVLFQDGIRYLISNYK